ncbi:hypothetical protein CAPTEDRAFT_215378 [Capitella teleta]|uniref:Uncharacterized protein n=1 Tax=Capitella teleta TaxID=283909 RepID=R7VDJ5_CAPTE|nr:hypothetical protein CAPTEDRAFT_215378 [Capitella teleta]|eukprot:ELU16637.1 hypothetical protein CAPTEDRAFT_215378 [Capitella teleta]
MTEPWTATVGYVLFAFGAVLVVIGTASIIYLCYIDSAERKREKDNLHLVGRYNKIRIAKHNEINGRITAETLGPYALDLQPPYVNPAVLYENAKPGGTPSIDTDSVFTDYVPKSTPTPDADSVVVTDLDAAMEDHRDSVFLVTGESKDVVSSLNSPSLDGTQTYMYRTYRHEPLPDTTEIEYSIQTSGKV